jgi:hypothetical protein
MMVVFLLLDQVSVPPTANEDALPVALAYVFPSPLGTLHLLIVTVVVMVPVMLLQVKLDEAKAGDELPTTATEAGTDSATAVAAANRTRRMGIPPLPLGLVRRLSERTFTLLRVRHR